MGQGRIRRLQAEEEKQRVARRKQILKEVGVLLLGCIVAVVIILFAWRRG